MYVLGTSNININITRDKKNNELPILNQSQWTTWLVIDII